MPAHSTAFKNAVLAGMFGTTRGSTAPDSYVVRLWSARPDADGALEADWVGYTPPEWSSDDWDAPDAAQVSSNGLVDFGAPGGAGTVAVRWWGLHDAVTDELEYSGPLSAPLSIAEASVDHVQIRPVVPYAN